MHDPEVVAFSIRRPWPQRTTHTPHKARRWNLGKHPDSPWWKPGSYSPFWTLAGRRYYWPPMVTIWHVEPGGADTGTVCKRGTRWRWHFWHWHVQVHPWQRLRRRIHDRCGLCGRRFPWSYGPIADGMDSKKIYHDECYSVIALRRREERTEETVRDLFAAYCLHANLSEMVALNRAAGPKSDWPYMRKAELARTLGYEMDDSTRVWEKRRADVS